VAIANRNRKKLAVCLSAAALLAAVVPAANAALVLTIAEGGGPAIPIVDNGPLDLDLAVSSIDANVSALGALLVNYKFNSLSATSNQSLGVPGSADPATLTQNGSAQRTQTGGTASITVIASDTDFLFPAGNPKSMTTAAADIFGFTTAGDSRTFQSVFDPTNFGSSAPGVASPLLAFVPPTGTGPFGTSNPGVDTALGTQPIPFAVYNTTVITLGANTNQATPQTDQFSGATTIIAVPEPTTLGAVMVVLSGGLLASRRRR
jgi:hypothetical protein